MFILVDKREGEDYVPLRNVDSEATLKIIRRRAQRGSTIYTDSLLPKFSKKSFWRIHPKVRSGNNRFKSYMGLKEIGYKHEYVNHSEWVRGECRINGCENRASLLRLWLAVHRGVCKDNLSLYLAAFKAYRRFRKINPIQAITKTIKINLHNNSHNNLSEEYFEG